MTAHVTGTREQWLGARLELLEAEKEFTRRGDELARKRQALPWVRVDKDYRFETREEGTVEYNYVREAPVVDIPSRMTPDGATTFAAMSGTDTATYARERPGISAFVLEDGVVYHTYSAYSRGVDGLWGMYQWLDRAPKGRNETGVWWKRHDEYGKR
jgi:predicted dithiol-disulfide oxidoreductase (DUF899 family)